MKLDFSLDLLQLNQTHVAPSLPDKLSKYFWGIFNKTAVSLNVIKNSNEIVTVAGELAVKIFAATE